MKSIRIGLVCVLVLCISGCAFLSSDQRASIERLNGWVAQGKSASADLDTKIAEVEKTIVEGEAFLAAGIPDEKTRVRIQDKINSAKEQLSDFKTVKAQVDASIAEYEKQLNGILAKKDVTGADLLDATGKTLTTSAASLPPPFNAYAGIGGIILSGIATAFGAKKAKQAKTAEKTIVEIVGSVGEALDSQPTEVKDAMKDTMSASNKVSASTRVKIAEVKARAKVA